MKTSSDELFQLIKSLEPMEKGYFKKAFSKGGEDIGFMKLFDIINAMEGDYDEEQVKILIISSILVWPAGPGRILRPVWLGC